MICWRRPAETTIRNLLEQQDRLDVNYDAPGSTRQATPPEGYRFDVNRVRLGEGDAVFEAARQAVCRWTMFDIGWAELFVLDSDGQAFAVREPVEGQTVTALFRLPLVWWLTPCRVVYTIDDQANGRQFGFAYGTLPGHPMRGEEQFLVQMDDRGVCWYSITAFSRTRHLLPRMGYPVVRRMQKRFVRQSLQAMQRAVNHVHS